MVVWKILSLTGLGFDLAGALCLARGLFISNKEALQLGVSRFAGESDHENLKLPAVRDRIQTRNWAVPGAALLVVGFLLQILSVLKQ
jgi:hypothetical protein